MIEIKEVYAFIAKSRPWINKDEMSPMLPISFEARDGLVVNGYITVPKNSDGKNLPLIVNPHGGPNARDYWGYNAEHQFLASRGYAVLSMNFRGSTGYGRNHVKMANGQWGRKMQDDVTDSVCGLLNKVLLIQIMFVFMELVMVVTLLWLVLPKHLICTNVLLIMLG